MSVDRVVRTAIELATAGTPDAAEVLAAQPRELLEQAHVRLVGGLKLNPFFDPTGIRATRLVTAALEAA
jgi:hypothetical protein